LRHVFNLVFARKMISGVPMIKLYEGENVRKDFIDVAETRCSRRSRTLT
jgi:hypothetical protein